jgi:predicted nucleic acid-binding protein
MIAVDTNVLVYAHRADSTFHLEAEQAYHGVAELWTVDRDIQRFSGLRVRNPLVGETGG